MTAKADPTQKNLDNYSWEEIKENQILLEEFAKKYFPALFNDFLNNKNHVSEEKIIFYGKVITWNEVIEEIVFLGSLKLAKIQDKEFKKEFMSYLGLDEWDESLDE